MCYSHRQEFGQAGYNTTRICEVIKMFAHSQIVQKVKNVPALFFLALLYFSWHKYIPFVFLKTMFGTWTLFTFFKTVRDFKEITFVKKCSEFQQFFTCYEKCFGFSKIMSHFFNNTSEFRKLFVFWKTQHLEIVHNF